MAIRRAVLLGLLGLLAAPPSSEGQPTLALPGACEPIPDDEWWVLVTRSGRGRDWRGRWSFATERGPDIDGDGVADAFVPLPDARRPQETCPAGLRRDVYVVRGGCGHRVGQIVGEPTGVGAVDPSTGLAPIATRVDVMSPAHSVADLRFAFDGRRYREVDRTTHRARCSVHPADCDPPVHHRCELRDHPTIRGYPDSDAIGARLGAAAREAQARCADLTSVVERCDVDPDFREDGTVRALRVRDCPRRRRCVAPIFRSIRIPPWTGREPLQSISFQIPAP